MRTSDDYYESAEALDLLECNHNPATGGAIPHLRVTGGTFEGSHLSQYACDNCSQKVYDIIVKVFPGQTEIVPLPTRS